LGKAKDTPPHEISLWLKGQEASSKPVVDHQLAIISELRSELQGTEGVGFEVLSDEDYEFLGELLNHSKVQLKEVESKKESVTKPINQALRAFQSWYLPPIKGWKSLIVLIKEKMGAYELKQIERREAAQLKLIEAAKEEDFDAAMEASEDLALETPEISGLSTKEVWVPDMDKVDIKKVPEPYLALDMSAVKQYIDVFQKRKEKPPDLPGLPFKREVRVFGTSGGKSK
jgi:hypothetical protein